MNNLYILTEERPKNYVIKDIIDIYAKKFNKNIILNDKFIILPEIDHKKHTFRYTLKGIKIEGIDEVIIAIVSGNSSFVDFLVFEQENSPVENEQDLNNLLLLIEETKTTDKESRNTGIYQRSSKFTFADYYYDNVDKIMLYNREMEELNRKPSDTNVFGTNLLLTQGVEIIGKNLEYYHKFEDIDEIIEFKNKMRKPPKGNVPIIIEKENDEIKISGRLSKPKNAGNIGHDPNVGALSSISKTLRVLGWDKKITITQHGVKQNYIDNIMNRSSSNKLLNIGTILNLELEGINFNVKNQIPDNYWYYEHNSEKLGTIFIHLLATALNDNVSSIYENHAGCERGYFYSSPNTPETVPKKIKTELICIYLI